MKTESKMKKFLVLNLAAVGTLTAMAVSKLADPFANGMVLQREKPVPVWGTADAGEKVKVTFAGNTVETTAGADGRWMCKLPAMAACKEGRTLKANGQEIEDVLVGDVWFVCGQSNTEFPIMSSNPHFSDRNGGAMAQITKMPLVRFVVQSNYRLSITPKTKAARKVEWLKYSPENLGKEHSFSAMGFYFGYYVHQASGVPLGLVGAYWGGTGIDPWTPREGTASRPDLADILAFKSTPNWDGKNPPSILPHNRPCDQPAVLWNEMVNPWCPYGMKGMIWYQGCTNSREPERYCSKMHALYNGWSQKFECPGMKLYFVQLAPWGFPKIATMQEVQAQFEREQPNAGMAVINDLGNLKDIHPNEKGTVGLRLALMALKRDYGFTAIEDRPPQLRTWRIEGDSFLLDFDHAEGMYVYNSDFSRETPFEVAGADGVWHKAAIANMVLEGRQSRGVLYGAGRLIVKSEKVHAPVKLRYCYSEPWKGTVYNKVNLPLAAFHIDGTATGESVGFDAARPIWARGHEVEYNSNVRFKATFEGKASVPTILRVTGSTSYRVMLNGAYVGYGPARGPKGFFRVDEWPLKVRDGANEIVIDGEAFNVNTYQQCAQLAFVQAEVLAGGNVVAATGLGGNFKAYPTDREQKVSRYSFQRAFAEAYRVGSSAGAKPFELRELPVVPLLPRVAPYPNFALNKTLHPISRAQAKVNRNRKVKPYPFEAGRNNFKAFARSEMTVDIWGDGALVDHTARRTLSGQEAAFPITLAAGESAVVDAGLNDCGFPGLTVTVKKPGKLIVTFDELLIDGEVDPTRMTCCNVLEWIFEKPGTYTVETIEPYVFRYANIFTLDGNMTVSEMHIRAYKNPEINRATFRCNDPALEKVFKAAKETFAQNAVDVFTDCPSRERAGWLCDSFFTARVAKRITGSTELERLFLQNYSLPASFDHLPKGMVPMCYPSDHVNGNFIPNWSMWLVIETEEYLKRSGDRKTIDILKPRYVALINYLKTFRNADGLLEKLPKWVFVEWSRSNKLVQDVNYPSNMTWAEVLDVMNRLYNMPELAAEAQKVRETVRKQSWTGKWFCDNAARQKDGTLKLSGECTETCQYYAFFFKTATPALYPELWNTLVNDFGPKRKETKKYPEIWPSNAFIGNYVRLECLAREGLARKILEETRGFFLYMAERTGTLWEHVDVTASCDHGFASHVAVTLYRDLMGVREIDSVNKTIRVCPLQDFPLEWCEGEVPLSPTEVASISCRKGADGKVAVKVNLPAGWKEVK